MGAVKVPRTPPPRNPLGKPEARESLAARMELAAPPPPPCFDSRAQWLGYLVSAEVSAEREVAPLVWHRQNGRTVGATFNRSMQFCGDCTERHRASMQLEGRCEPDWLRNPESGAP